MNIQLTRMALVALFSSFMLSACDHDDDPVPEEPQQPEAETRICLCPDYLQPGDKIAVISPSYWSDSASLAKGMDGLREMGFEPVLAPNAARRYLEKYAGTPAERAADWEWAYRQSDVKAIMASRGGYGTIQLLPLLDAGLLQEHPKWLIGYSDITTLLSFSVSANVMAIHGTLLSSLKNTGGKSDDDRLLRQLLLGELPRYEWESGGHPNRTGTARGILVGGNMCTFTPLIGSEYDFTSKGDIILFVEEIGENARNIDRMMYSLKIHGVLSRVKGILVGDFYACGDEFKIGSIEEMFDKYTLADVDVPIAYGFRAGHAGVNWPLVEGAPVTLTADTDRATLVFDLP